MQMLLVGAFNVVTSLSYRPTSGYIVLYGLTGCLVIIEYHYTTVVSTAHSKASSTRNEFVDEFVDDFVDERV